MLRSRKTFLTSPHSVKTSEEVLLLLKERLFNYDIEYLCVVEEKHEDGTPHLHVVFKTQKQPKVSFTELEKIFGKHVNVQTTRNEFDALSYLNKSGTPLTHDGNSFAELLELKALKQNISSTISRALIDGYYSINFNE